MYVEVYSISSDKTDVFSGTPEQLRNQLLATYPFLDRYKNSSLQEDLSKLSQQQNFMVSVRDS